jgi:F420-dependent oxidoreductase-like protein
LFQGRHYEVPLPADRGTGLGKPLKLINHPVRERIPVMLAAIGPKNVELAAELAEGWLPVFVHPAKLRTVWGASLDAGLARRDPGLGPLDIVVTMKLAIGDHTAGLIDRGRPQLALYLGGMGARGKNFYNDLARRYGFDREAELIQDLYLAGRKREAEAAVPEELLRATSLVGPKEYVAERLAELTACGVTTVSVTPLADDPAERLAAIERLRDLLP